jgi:hypothetical protein
MEKGITFVGLDVHKESINVAMLLPGESRPVEWQTSNLPTRRREPLRGKSLLWPVRPSWLRHAFPEI